MLQPLTLLAFCCVAAALTAGAQDPDLANSSGYEDLRQDTRICFAILVNAVEVNAVELVLWSLPKSYLYCYQLGAGMTLNLAYKYPQAVTASLRLKCAAKHCFGPTLVCAGAGCAAAPSTNATGAECFLSSVLFLLLFCAFCARCNLGQRGKPQCCANYVFVTITSPWVRCQCQRSVHRV